MGQLTVPPWSARIRYVDARSRCCCSEGVEAAEPGGKRRKWNGTEAYLAGVDLLAAESVVVGTHDGGR